MYHVGAGGKSPPSHPEPDGIIPPDGIRDQEVRNMAGTTKGTGGGKGSAPAGAKGGAPATKGAPAAGGKGAGGKGSSK